MISSPCLNRDSRYAKAHSLGARRSRVPSAPRTSTSRDDLRHLATVRARVRPDRAADGAWDADRPVEPGKTSLRAALGERGHRRAGFGDQRRAVDRRPRRRGRGRRGRGCPASATTRSLPLPSRKAGTPASRREPKQPDELVDRRGGRQAVGAAPDAQRGERRQRHVCPQARLRARRRARRADRSHRPRPRSRRRLRRQRAVLGERQQLRRPARSRHRAGRGVARPRPSRVRRPSSRRADDLRDQPVGVEVLVGDDRSRRPRRRGTARCSAGGRRRTDTAPGSRPRRRRPARRTSTTRRARRRGRRQRAHRPCGRSGRARPCSATGARRAGAGGRRRHRPCRPRRQGAGHANRRSSRGSASATAVFSRVTACEPPKTRSRRSSGPRPKERRAAVAVDPRERADRRAGDEAVAGKRLQGRRKADRHARREAADRARRTTRLDVALPDEGRDAVGPSRRGRGAGPGSRRW